jgi:hypothetical protein
MMKKNNISAIQLFLSGGLYFPPIFIAVICGSKNGFWNSMPVGILFAVCAVFAMAVYIGVHWLPIKIATIAGACGWLSIPILLIFFQP